MSKYLHELTFELHANEAWDWSIGLSVYTGVDENGDFKALEIGIGLFSLMILRYIR